MKRVKQINTARFLPKTYKFIFILQYSKLKSVYLLQIIKIFLRQQHLKKIRQQGVQKMSNSVENHSDEEITNNHQFKRKILEESQLNKNKRIKSDFVEKIEIKIEEKKEKNDKKFCAKCNKRLKLLCDFTCRCGKVFCAAHRFNDQHNCSFDYRKEATKALEKTNPKIVHDKIARI